MEKFKKLKVSMKELKENKSVFEIQKFERGVGRTIANSLRRILLSSIPGYAVFKIKIKDIKHEFATINGIDKNVALIILQLKKLEIKVEGNTFDLKNSEDDIIELKLVNKIGEIVAKDILCPPGVSIINKDLHIANSVKEGALNMILYVKKGRGYSTSIQNEAGNTEKEQIFIDSNFSPVKLVNYEISELVTHKILEEEKIILNIETNNTISPEKALTAGCQILISHYSGIGNTDENENQEIINNVDEKKVKYSISRPIEHLKLQIRTYNSLKRSGIINISQVVSKTKDELYKFSNFGDKAYNDLIEQLEKNNLKIKD